MRTGSRTKDFAAAGRSEDPGAVPPSLTSLIPSMTRNPEQRWRLPDSGRLALHEFLQLFFGHDFAVEQVDFALRVLNEPWVVSDHADGCAFAMEILKQLHDGFAVARIQIPGGLIR